jgi:hypothetical protein
MGFKGFLAIELIIYYSTKYLLRKYYILLVYFLPHYLEGKSRYLHCFRIKINFSRPVNEADLYMDLALITLYLKYYNMFTYGRIANTRYYNNNNNIIAVGYNYYPLQKFTSFTRHTLPMVRCVKYELTSEVNLDFFVLPVSHFNQSLLLPLMGYYSIKFCRT